MKYLIIPTIAFLTLTSCSIDIRQLPGPKKNPNNQQTEYKKILTIRDLKISSNELSEIESAWKYILISYLKNDSFLNKNFLITDSNDLSKELFLVDITIKPNQKEERNYWWSIPVIYPITLIWPIHYRKLEYTVSIEYSISKNGKKIISDHFELKEFLEIYFYGLSRTFIFEEFIEDINKKAIEKCVSEISLYLYQF
ncbi:hypothetical protein EHR01_12205 [Leptospira mtsangambouensis]|uniref:Lipoprotein n=1 Tax=Leptospira mtsangambouensis TaxID=2484912 RepID=A0ABY2NZQ2_9LEPT|nr:hypothetical protein [Leptospira mtsangambouensis]TGM74260.1 hypothetical protein EHR01_12205 [Leptospira mtsangambouensis]